MDVATVIGLIALVTALMAGIGPHLDLVLDGPSLLMVGLAGLGLTLIALPMRRIAALPRVVGRAFLVRNTPPIALVTAAVGMAEVARAEGMLALEHEVARHDHDRFLAAGIRLAVDGTEPDLIMDILETELRFIEDRHKAAQAALRVFGHGLLLAGGATLLLGLVLGGQLGVTAAALPTSLIAPLYGLVGWGIALALAHKLSVHGDAEVLVKRMAVEAVMAIQSGDNPRIVEHKLSVFLPPVDRPSGPTVEPRTPPDPARDPRLVDAVAELAAGRGDTGFGFQDLARLSDRDTQVLLRAIEQKALVLALKGAGDAVAERFLGNMSERVRHFIEEEMAFAGDVDASVVVDMQDAIAHQARRLAVEDKIQLPE